MKRKLFKQIRAEWRTNVWLALELLIVSVVMWYIVDYFYINLTIMSQPRGYDTEHCYRLSFNTVTDKNPGFIKDRTYEETCSDADEILTRLKHLPFVEAASLSVNSHPYNGSSNGTYIQRDSLTQYGYLPFYQVTPDFVKVFRYEGFGGESAEQMADMIEKGELLMAGSVFGDLKYSAENLVGLDFTLDGDTTRTYRLGAALRPVRHNDYTEWGTVLVKKLPLEHYGWADEYCIRVRPDMDRDIEKQLMDMSESLFHVGNNLLVNVTSFKFVRERYQQAQSNQMRDMIFLLCFLLLNIFLGLFGTFWFRTQQRTGEIAIRMSMGATKSDIFRRLLTEGLILLVIVTPFAVALDCLLAWNEFSQFYEYSHIGWGRMAVTCSGAFLLIALMIAGGIWIPASRARRIQPAIALKDE